MTSIIHCVGNVGSYSAIWEKELPMTKVLRHCWKTEIVRSGRRRFQSYSLSSQVSTRSVKVCGDTQPGHFSKVCPVMAKNARDGIFCYAGLLAIMAKSIANTNTNTYLKNYWQ